jgi:hypothetical protein
MVATGHVVTRKLNQQQPICGAKYAAERFSVRHCQAWADAPIGMPSLLDESLSEGTRPPNPLRLWEANP